MVPPPLRTDQVTSWLTPAGPFTVPLTLMVCPENSRSVSGVTTTVIDWRARLAVPNAVASAVDVARTTTVCAAGTVAGAVYWTLLPLVADSVPGPEASMLQTKPGTLLGADAFSVALWPPKSELGLAVTCTIAALAGETVSVTVPNLVASSVEVARMTTGVATATLGAVYVAPWPCGTSPVPPPSMLHVTVPLNWPEPTTLAV